MSGSLHSDWQTVQNYPGVETELLGHIDNGAYGGSDTHAKVAGFVDGELVLNTIGLIVKTRNNITNARMIFDVGERSKR